ncbi:MAG: hypothetical protein WC476_11735 [Phycisphaerae bacterium]|jgi:hypothetical protein
MNKKAEKEVNHAENNARGWYETIVEQVNALEMDWERYQELKEMNETDLTADEKQELKELTETAGEYESQDDVRQRIEESPLSIQTRGGWHNPGEQADDEEFEILLSTGGPALRLIGELDQYKQPEKCRLEHQDWGTPWTELYNDVDPDILQKWANVFYFGE